MGDLLVSPSVAPFPLFCMAPWGEGVAASFATAPILSDGAEPDCMGIQRLPRRIRQQGIDGLATPPFCPSSSFFYFLLSSHVGFLFCFRARGVAPGAQAAESGTGPISRRFIPLCAVPPRRGEQTLGRSVSDRAPLVAALPSPMAQ
jgi:hypothetical protein